MGNINKVLKQRKKTHGSFTNHSRLSQALKRSYSAYKISDLSDSQQEALDMILHKIARIGAGNPNEKDHWVDIGGYAQLIVNEIEQQEKENKND